MSHAADAAVPSLGLVGSDIAAMRVMTVELRFAGWAQTLHDRPAQLSILAFSSKLEMFVAKVGRTRAWVDAIRRYVERQDRGFSLFWMATRLERCNSYGLLPDGDCSP
ncbi:hypothetical protein BDW75DRAFT_246485 [Aspergillus navahoensis]